MRAAVSAEAVAVAEAIAVAEGLSAGASDEAAESAAVEHPARRTAANAAVVTVVPAQTEANEHADRAEAASTQVYPFTHSARPRDHHVRDGPKPGR